MCGITGTLLFNKNLSIDKSLLKSMTNILTHRGPDDAGYFIDSCIGLGHRRLSIIDLSKNGKQPMSNKDGSMHIIFNGEIYNFLELRKELDKYDFVSDSDTETILHGYEEYGVGVLKKLRGMFSFAIWDSNKKELFIARDRVGKKPLFYYHDKDKFVFASELKSIILDKDIKKDIDHNAISHYLTYGYIPAPLSIFKNIYKLMPGHYMVIGKDGVKINQYWDLIYSPVNKSEQYYMKNILRALEQAVKIRLISDVPLGALLSGGIDSSAVTALMSKHLDEVKTFSIGFEEAEFDETRYARMIAEKFNTNHKEMIVKPDTIKILPKIVWHYDEPYSDSSALPTYYLSQMTRKYVTVALNGDGGDENFAGYNRHAINNAASTYLKFPSFVRKSLKTFAYVLPEPKSQKSPVRYVKRFSELASLSAGRRYIELLKTFDDKTKNELFQSNVNSNFILAETLKNKGLNKFLYCDVKRYLADDLLVKMDRATMAHSLEARSPFLDHKFMEFAATIPPHLKLRGFNKKYILKKALRRILPKEVLYRKKMGFGAPIDHWFRKELFHFAESTLLGKRSLPDFNKRKVQQILYQHKKGLKNNCHKIWSLLMLEMWYKVYVDEQVKIKQ